MKIKMAVVLFWTLAIQTYSGISGQDNQSSVVAYVGAYSGPTNGLRLLREGRSDALNIGCPLLANDNVSVSRGNTLTLILPDGSIEAVEGPNQWKALRQSKSNGLGQGLSERLRRWFDAREIIITRAAGSRAIGSSPKRLYLVCAEFSHENSMASRSKSVNTSYSVVWAGVMTSKSVLTLNFWNGDNLLKSIALDGQEWKNYEEVTGLHLFKAVSSVKLEGTTNITHVSLIDPRARINAESARLNWTNVWNSEYAAAQRSAKIDETRDNSGSLLSKGIVLEAQGHAPAALEAYFAILAKEPHHQAAHEALATFFDEHGSPGLARWHLLALTER